MRTLLTTLLFLSSVSLADEPQRLSAIVSAGTIAGQGSAGFAAATGLRLTLGRHFALGFDVGYGLMDAAPNLQDRWWIIPTAAFVLPLGSATLDVGAGLGVGEDSSFPSFAKVLADKPAWSFQLIPAVRAHVTLSTPLSPRVDLFTRLDAGALLMEGNALGLREGAIDLSNTDTFWLGLSVGFRFRLL